MASPLLLVEDTPSLSLVYETVLTKGGYTVDCAYTFAEAQKMYASGKHKTILLDLVLPDGDGSDLMDEILRANPDAKVIVITANGSVNRAVEAMRAGAFDFLVKPFDESGFLSAVRNAIKATERGQAKPKRKQAEKASGFQGFIGSSPPMRRIYDMVNSIGQSTATVFITGESGTGKEVCAQAIHDVSNRSDGPFVPLNCGAIPRDLLESEVFGHLRDGPRASDQAPAVFADLHDPARGRHSPETCGCAHRLCHQPRPPRRSAGGSVPRGPLLPAARGADPPAKALRARQ